MQNINHVVLTGNLTRDPELRSTRSGMSVCSLRLASNTRRKSADGTWGDKANYFDVTVFGAQGDNCARFLAKGSGVAVQGRLEWSEWEAQDGGKRQSVQVIADNVQFLGGGPDRDRRHGDQADRYPSRADTEPVAGTDDYGNFANPAVGSDDDIPF